MTKRIIKSNAVSISCRPFEKSEWEALRDIRLKALKTDPKFFTSTYDKERRMSPDWWQETAQSEKCVVFGVFIDNRPVGCMGISTFAKDPSGETAVLWGTFIHPDWRGKGLTTPLYKTVIAYANRRTDWKRILVSHREGNEASKHTVLAHGFRYTSSVAKKWPDGVREPEHFYVLDLGKKTR